MYTGLHTGMRAVGARAWAICNQGVQQRPACGTGSKRNPLLSSTISKGLGREEGGGFRMGNTCIPVADSFLIFGKTNTIM